MLKFFKDVGDEYEFSGHASSFIPDLLTVDAPQLFQHNHLTVTRSGNLGKEFTRQLSIYIMKNSLRKCLLQKFPQIMVSSDFVVYTLETRCVISNKPSLLYPELFNFRGSKNNLSRLSDRSNA